MAGAVLSFSIFRSINAIKLRKTWDVYSFAFQHSLSLVDFAKQICLLNVLFPSLCTNETVN